jgi:hypothetical protein
MLGANLGDDSFEASLFYFWKDCLTDLNFFAFFMSDSKLPFDIRMLLVAALVDFTSFRAVGGLSCVFRFICTPVPAVPGLGFLGGLTEEKFEIDGVS